MEHKQLCGVAYETMVSEVFPCLALYPCSGWLSRKEVLELSCVLVHPDHRPKGKNTTNTSLPYKVQRPMNATCRVSTKMFTTLLSYLKPM